MSKPVSVKYMFAGSLRRTYLNQISYREFNKRVCESFPKNFEESKVLSENLAFRYVDEEEEVVTITCDHELTEAFQNASNHNRILLVYIDDISQKVMQSKKKSECPKFWRKKQASDHTPNSSIRRKCHSSSKSQSNLCAKFVDDIGFQDNSFVSQGEKIGKVWRLITSSGLPEGCCLQFVSGYDLGHINSTPLAKVMPNSTFDVKVQFSAPKEDGEFRSYWRLISPGGQRFGPKLWTVFRVCGEGLLHEASVATKKDPTLHASFVEDVTLPDATKVGYCQRLTKIWRMKSDNIIPEGCQLRFLGGNLQPISKCIPLTDETTFQGKLKQVSGVPPKYAKRYFSPTFVRVMCDGCNKRNLQKASSYWHCDLNDLDLCNMCKAKTDREKKTKFFTISAEILTPNVNGRYRSFWRMISPSGTHFGPTLWCDLDVSETNTENSKEIRHQKSCLFAQNLDCNFLEDVTIPDGCQVEADTSLEKIWRLSTQSGIPEGCRLVFTCGDNLGIQEQMILPAVKGSSEFDVYLTIKVPSEKGSYRGYWRLVSPQGKHFGPTLWTDITVASDTVTDFHINVPKVDFVADITIPDASKVRKHKLVKKTWRLKSNQPFPKGAILKQVGGDKVQVIESAVFKEVVNSTAPGDLKKASGLAPHYCSGNFEHPVTVVCDGCSKRNLQSLDEGYWHSKTSSTDFCNSCKDSGKFQTIFEIDVSVKVLTPEKSGRTRSFWKLSLEGGQRFGPKLWIDMDVQATTKDESEKSTDTSKKETYSSDTTKDHRPHLSSKDIQIMKQLRSMGFELSDETILELIKSTNGNVSQIVVALTDQK